MKFSVEIFRIIYEDTAINESRLGMDLLRLEIAGFYHSKGINPRMHVGNVVLEDGRVEEGVGLLCH